MRTLFELIRYADNLHAAQLAYLNKADESTSRSLRHATHAYAIARATLKLPEVISPDTILDNVFARLTALDLNRPVSPQEIMIAKNSIRYTYEELMDIVGEEKVDLGRL